MPETITLELFEHPEGANMSRASDKHVWHPFETIRGRVVVERAATLLVERLVVHLEGVSRIWIQFLDDFGRPRLYKASYKFLHQSHEITKISQPFQESTSRNRMSEGGFYFVLPGWAIPQASDIPDQCLALPPTVTVGRVLPGDQDGELYAQPNVTYSVRAVVEFKNPKNQSTKSGAARREFQVVPYSESRPPTEISDFGSDFVASVSNRYATKSGHQYEMTLTMREPKAVCFFGQETAPTIQPRISITVQSVAAQDKTENLSQLLENLKTSNFKSQASLRVKTFYSTTPFSKLPARNMATPTGLVRLHEEKMNLAAHVLNIASWNYETCLVPGAADSVPPSNSWASSTNIVMPKGPTTRAASENLESSLWSAYMVIQCVIPSQLPPTFCSAIASRQYSLMVRFKIYGIEIDDFDLEMPLQIVYCRKGCKWPNCSSIEATRYNLTEQALSVFDPSEHECNVSHNEMKLTAAG